MPLRAGDAIPRCREFSIAVRQHPFAERLLRIEIFLGCLGLNLGNMPASFSARYSVTSCILLTPRLGLIRCNSLKVLECPLGSAKQSEVVVTLLFRPFPSEPSGNHPCRIRIR